MREGDTIEFCAATFDFDTGLVLHGRRGVTLRGSGKDFTVLRFGNSGSSEGINVSHTDGITIENLTVQDTPGMLSARLVPTCSRSMVAAWRRKPAANRGEACQWRTVSGTGRRASCPFRGSRMIPEKKDEAARFGLPGRTAMVGRRMARPSM